MEFCWISGFIEKQPYCIVNNYISAFKTANKEVVTPVEIENNHPDGNVNPNGKDGDHEDDHSQDDSGHCNGEIETISNEEG